MKWQTKMKQSVENTLNSLVYGSEFEVTVIDEHNFKVTENGSFCYSTETLEHLPSRWKLFARKAITDILHTKVDILLSN